MGQEEHAAGLRAEQERSHRLARVRAGQRGHVRRRRRRLPLEVRVQAGGPEGHQPVVAPGPDPSHPDEHAAIAGAASRVLAYLFPETRNAYAAAIEKQVDM